jgi:hypothetical protein
MKDLGKFIGIFRGSPEANTQAATALRQDRITQSYRIINRQITPEDRTRFITQLITDATVANRLIMASFNTDTLRFVDSGFSTTYQMIREEYSDMPAEEVDRRMILQSTQELEKEIKAATKRKK